ncbi:MAG: DUF1800 domain-containing protein [Planctomycetota bacterium]|jgi:uncharacterized protein (DUF1800 family)
MPGSLQGRAAVGHLLRRAAFGAGPADLISFADVSYEDAVGQLLEGLAEPPPADPPGFDPFEPGAIQQAWLERMVSGRTPLAERLALFWHGHFATSDAKLKDPSLLWEQYRLFRTKGAGRFRDLVQAVSRDVAMIRWLDGNANRAGHPNENFARELQELFVLGIGNYTETDVREVARAFTGWGSRGRAFVYQARFHDDGLKTVHGRTQAFDGDEVVELLTSLDVCHRFLAGKLVRAFSHPDPGDAEIQIVADALKRSDGDVLAALEALFHAPFFLGEERHRALVRSPVEYAVAGLRAAGVERILPWVHGALDRMGQVLFRPPSVKGWPSGTIWLGSAGMVARLHTALRIAEAAPPDAADWIVGTAFDGRPPPVLADALAAGPRTERVALALASPEFQLA